MKNVTLIFIDNNKTTLNLLQEYFSHFKTNIKKLYFNSPQDFKNWLKKRRDNRRLIIIVDYVMPEMTGVELLKEIQEKAFVCVLLTGITKNKQIAEALQKGIVHYHVNKDSVNFLGELEDIIEQGLYSLSGCKKIPK